MEPTFLQQAWFLLVGVLIVGYAVLDGFDLGAGIQHLYTARTDEERRLSMNSIGPVWDGNEVWLITAGGALFASFPLVYASVFSGFYLAFMLALAALILRAVSMEFRSKEAGKRWRSFWDFMFFLGSSLVSILLGVAIGNVLRGVALDSDGYYAGSFIELLNPFSLLCGVLAFGMFLMQGGIWLTLKTSGAMQARARKAAGAGWLVFVVMWAAVTLYSSQEAPHLWGVYANVIAWVIPALLAIAVLAVPLLLRAGRTIPAFIASSLSVALLIATFGVGLYPTLLPARGEGQSLTIVNSSSGELTLSVMLLIAVIGMPHVIVYTAYVYSRFWGKTRLDEASY